MHIVKWDYIDSDAQKALGSLAKDGVEYLAEDDVAGSYMHAYSNTIKVRPYDGDKLFSPHIAATGKRLLVMRAGGLGDILFLTPAIHALKTRRPEVEIYASCMGQSPYMLFNNPEVSGFMPYPIRLDQANDFDGIIAVEHMIEYSSAARTMHAVDLFAMAFGLELGPDEKQIRYFLSKEEKEGAATFLPKRPRGKFRVGVQIASNLPVRTYAQMPNVAKALMARGHQVVVFGAPGQPLIQGAINTHGQDPPLNIRQSSTLIPECDVIIAPDSAITHLAGALDVPCIAIYGSFLAKLRTAYAQKTKAIQAEGPCAPCFHHGRMSNFPIHCPSKSANVCGVLESITTDTIIEQAIDWAGEWKA